ncbi:hypothetical protein [Ralstonia sp. ASV6]|uniref:hypothetical protein n=1 Tax=Ralstonia sp. ASV6 TaxID=2795124 RepID=UPI0018EB190D|nr:hypothetical protein [Ralstonia sp. ASV6]
MTCNQQRFERDVAGHQMNIVRDDGVNRHLIFKKPGTSDYWFEILTWPGALAIRGDCGANMFTRVVDMFDFFRTKPERLKPGVLHINPQYWKEKIIAVDSNCGERGSAKKFSIDEFKRQVVSWFRRYTASRWYEENRVHRWAIWAAIRNLLDHETDPFDASRNYQLLSNFSVWIEDEAKDAFQNFFDDFWEVDCTEYDFNFLWNCYAIAWAIQRYDATKVAAKQAETEAA